MSAINKRSADIQIYERLILSIQDYFKGEDVQYMFLHEGCYFLAVTLQQYIPDSLIVFNRKIRHCASLFNDGVYDIRGRIPSGGFWIATAEDMQYMQKHFIPSFDAEVLENYLKIAMNKSKGMDGIVL